MKFNFVKEVGGDGRGKTYAKRAVFITVNLPHTLKFSTRRGENRKCPKPFWPGS